jgi:hypothetical protein
MKVRQRAESLQQLNEVFVLLANNVDFFAIIIYTVM